MKHSSYLITALLALLFLTLYSCTTGGKSSDTSHTLTVSIEPQRYLLQSIAGDRWTINTLLDKGADPENFDPALSSLKALQDSRAYFTVGTIPFEQSLLKRIGNNGTTYIVDTSTGIPLIEGTHTACNHDHAHSHDTDPHIWFSVPNAKIMARNMLNALTEIDPEHAPTYTENYHILQAQLDSLDRTLTAALAPAKDASFLVWHPSLSYFARDYSLRQIAIAMDNKELSADAFRRRIDEVTNHKTAILFVQPEFDGNRSDNIVRQTGIQSTPINTLAYDFPAEMRRIAHSFTTTLTRP